MKYTLRPGYTITEVCTTEATETCSSNGAVSISFLRPDPDAIIRKTAVLGTPQQSAKIKVSSPGDKVKYINVTQAGQIYVN
ncbi:MAG: hypothetical protein KAS07_04725 [Candidatus Pacebacteria bacterium]|nr:hypothetical protein [Candidatus Paceibacterota bacterium]